ncbi:TlpA family protein disulfide reductase [Hymenobacter terrestris]|uniref:TlpA family protein disulfide reductase n=1 Tax=Hymenobacter terrestris TaxID=2748310 RepID=A0ABX2Q352_9BACT|nr:TlpA disulfide reductase family protein [Hymenobacter terrestris]NVO85401.1 TlpA family protein disulfide reductase [Hymenobacter terrestris]
MLFSLPVVAFGAALRLLLAPPLTPSVPPVPAVVSGHLDHAPAGDSVRLEYAGHYGPKATKAKLGPDGTFSVALENLKGGTPAEFSYAGQRTGLYLSPGDRLQLALDFPRFDETLRYTGRGADANNYLAQSLWKFEYGPAGTPPRPELTPTTTAGDLRRVADAFRHQRQAFLAAYAKAHPLPADFQRNAALDIDLQWAITLLEYPGYRRYVAKQAAALPADYYGFLSQLPLKKFDQYLSADRGLAGNTNVMRFLNGYGSRLVPTGALSTDPAEAGRLYARATADFGPTAARDRAVFQLLSFAVGDNLPGVLAAYPTFRTQNRDSVMARDLRVLLQKQLLISPGRLAPAFTLRDHEGKAVALQDLRGQVVYLDFWGTWCRPCMEEMPASRELRKQFAGREVVFVYVAMGDKAEKWQQVLAAERLTGPGSVHLRDQEQKTGVDYQVFRYPTYFLIGRDGRIVTGNAPRPSNAAAAAAAIETALKQ